MNVIKSTNNVNNAIRKAHNLSNSLLPKPKQLKLQSGKNTSCGASTSYVNGTMYMCEIVSDVGNGIYKVKAFMDITDTTTYQYMYLTALDMGFDDVYYPGSKLIASTIQLNSISVVEE